MQIRDNTGQRRVILDEIDILLVESTAVSITAALLAELTERKVKVIFCDRQRNPVAELVPYHGCHDSTRRIKAQLAWTSETKALVWKEIVREKIGNQEKVLRKKGSFDSADLLANFRGEVQPGDNGNREGLAAKSYFTALFGSNFTRGKKCDINSALDYGYQVLLSVFTREIACEGYLAQFGIFHDSVFNSFNLASDLMEPFRPFVDSVVRLHFLDSDNIFDTSVKRKLVQLLHEDIKIGEAKQSMINAAILYARSVTSALNSNDTTQLKFPVLEC